MSQFVYLLEDQNTQLIKIGISIDPEFRAKQIDIAFGTDTKILGILEIEDAARTEKFIHGMLSAHRVIGEWFEIDSKQKNYLLAYFDDKIPPAKIKAVQKTTSFLPQPKAVIQARLKALNMTQIQLAGQLKTTPAILSRALSGSMIRTDSYWPAILDALGLEVVIQPKQTPK